MLETSTILVIVLYVHNSLSEEAFCTLNGKKALHKVNEKFLSISIDPAVLLTGLNLSDDSLKLAQHLSPAYIRIAGPSTRFVKYAHYEDLPSPDDSNNIVVTPSMWFGINEWLILANLTPLFAINDIERTQGLWNPKSTLPLFEISDKLNLTCSWQLGFDCSNKTEQQYKQDIDILHNVLKAFPDRADTWAIVAADLSRCIDKQPESALNDVKELVAAAMWEPDSNNDLSSNRAKVPIWTAVPKPVEPISFDSALMWAQQAGNGARMGYEVVFREPRLHEMFSDTPVYWFSLLHKKLMGRVVLDVRSTRNNEAAAVFAHCTKKQNSFVRRGAMTILIVNNGNENYTALFRQSNTNLGKTIEVQSYLLQSAEDEAEVLLNGEKLTMDLLNKEEINLVPKIRRAKSTRPLSLDVPPKSIGFFVLPNARVPVCINEEHEMDLLLEEMNKDQNLPLSNEIVLKVAPRSSGSQPANSLQELHDRMEKELKWDEKFYKRAVLPKRKLSSKVVEQEQERKFKVKPDVRQFFIERARISQRKQKPVHNSNFLQFAKDVKTDNKNKDLDLNSAEVKTILKSRAKAKAARKNIAFSSAELDELIGRASKKFGSSRRFTRDINLRLLNRKSQMHGRNTGKGPVVRSPSKVAQDFNERIKKIKTRLSNNRRLKREINMDLLKLKSKDTRKVPLLEKKKKIKTFFKDKEDREASIRRAGETSEEFLEKMISEESSEEKDTLPKGDIFAELEDTKKKSKKVEENSLRFLTASDEFDDFEDDFPCIHEYKCECAESKESEEDVVKQEEPKKKKKTKAKANLNHILFKRDTNSITKDDVRSYRKMMHQNLEDLKRLAIEDELKTETNSLKEEMLESIASNKKLAALKKKLAQKKKLEKLLRKRTKEVDFLEHIDQIADTEKSLALKEKLESILQSRSKRDYKSLTDNYDLKPNKFHNQNEIYFNSRSGDWEPRTQKSIFAAPVKSKRSISTDVSSIENEIEDISNDFERNLKFIHPKIDNGKIELILPNQDELKIEKKKNETDFAFYHRHNVIVKSTTETVRNQSHIQKVPSREEQMAMHRLVNTVTGWFHSISNNIKSFVSNIF